MNVQTFPEDTCLVAVEKNNTGGGYAEIEISNREPLEDFSIMMWVKTRARLVRKNAWNMSIFSYTVKDNVVLDMTHFEQPVPLTKFTLVDKTL